MTKRSLRVLLGGVNLLDVHGQYSGTHNAEFAKTPFSVGCRQVPLGLLYLAAAQRRFGRTPCDYLLFDFDLPAGETFTLDAVFAAFQRHLEDHRPDVVALGCLTQRQNAYLERAISLSRSHAPGARIVVGGAPATAEPARFLSAGADAVALGEGEMTFVDFIECVAAGGSLDDVAGLALRAPRGARGLSLLGGAPGVRRTKERPLVADLDQLPMPAWDLIDMARYIRKNRGLFASVLTERGCPYACVYCDHDRRFRAHSAKRVVDELEILSRDFGARRIDIIDEIFNCRKDRVLAIRDEKRRRGLDVRLQDFDGMRADILDEETVDALREMGFDAFSVAIEAASPRVQRLIKKNLKIDKTVAAIQWAVDRGIFVNTFFMVGFPTETPDEVAATLRLARGCASHQSTISKVEAYPGTPMWDLAVEHGLDTARFSTDFIERYGERQDPGFMTMSEEDLHTLWLRGVFDVYNDPARMRRLSKRMRPISFAPMYRKFYEEHGVWSEELAASFEARMNGGPDFEGIAAEAERRYGVSSLDELLPEIRGRAKGGAARAAEGA
ncbi:MAG: B12-binding domain-containing radical SAM protein [Polyangiaceae bacterium]|nr:B12-binding domain-containing radical SAM protein [Polyangiaceae bacterium]